MSWKKVRTVMNCGDKKAAVNKKFTKRLKVIYIEMLCFKGIFRNQSLCEGVKCPKNVQNWKIKWML